MANECSIMYDYNVGMNRFIVLTITRNLGDLATAKYSQASLINLFNLIHNLLNAAGKIPSDLAVQRIIDFVFAYFKHNKISIENADTVKKEVVAQIQAAFKSKSDEVTDGTTPVQLEDKNDTVILLRALNLKQKFAELYGANAHVKDRLQTNLLENIVEVLYYNLTKPNKDKSGNIINYGYLVTGNGLSLFNRNIYDLLGKYFKYLVDYISDNNLGTEELRNSILGTSLYNSNGLLNSDVYEVLHIIDDYIKDNPLHNAFISLGYAEESLKGQSFLQTSGTSPGYRYYKMVESFYCLSYFDDLIADTIGNIHVTGVLKNNFAITNKIIKYKTALDKQGRYTGFSMDDMRNGFSEAGRFSKTILNTLPLYKYLGSRLEGAHIEYPTVVDAFAVLKRAVLLSVITSTENKETSNYRFIRAVLDVMGGPKNRIYTILSILFKENPNILDTLRKDTSLLFSDEMVNTLYSLWKFVYDPNPEGHTSFMELENRQLFGNSINRNSSYSLLDCISGLILRVTSMYYVNTSFDDDGMNVQIRAKFSNSRAIMNLRDLVNFRLLNASLSEREHLVNTYKLTTTDNGIRIKINDRLQLVVTPASDKRLLLDHTRNKVYIIRDGNTLDIDEWFKKSDIDLLSYDPSAILDNLKNELDFKDVLLFILNVLGIETLTTLGLNTLYIYSNNFTTMLTDLVDGAGRFVLANEAYLKYLNAPDDKPSLPEFLILKYPDLYRVVGTISNGKLDLTQNFYHYVLEFGEGNYRMVAGHKSLRWLDGYTAALLLLTGGKKKMTTLNFSGKQEQAGRTDFLGNELLHQILKIRGDLELANDEINKRVNKVAELLGSLTKDVEAYKLAVISLGIEFIPESVSATVERYREAIEKLTRRVATSNILFAKNHKLISNVVVLTDVKSPTQRVKLIKGMNEGELLINAIFQLFWGCQSSADSLLALNFIILPTTYSDKTFILTYLINGGSFKIDGNTYNLQNLTHELTVKLIKSTVGRFYLDLAHNIILDWNRIFAQAKRNDPTFLFDKPCESIALVNKVLLTNNFNKFQYIRIALLLGIEVFEDLYIVNRKDGRLQANELLQYYITTFNDEELLSKFLNNLKLLFINDLLKQNYILDIEDEVIAPAVHANSGIKENWSYNGVLILGKVRDAEGNIVKNITNLVSISLNPGEVLELNPIFEKYYNSFNVVASNLRLLATGTELVHPYSKTSSKLTSLTQVLAVRLANLLNALFDNWIDFRDKIELNKSILSEKDYAIGLRLYENAMLQFAGITGAQGASLKRNVIIPGTLLVIQQKLLSAPLPKIKIAIIDDIKAYVNLINCRKKVIDANDGSAFKSPLQNIMENRSLLDLEVGWDTKFISQGYNTLAGVPQLQKFAAYAITNTRMKLSMLSTTSLYNLYKKMHNLQWRDKSGKWANSRGVTIDLVDGKRYGYSNYDPKKSYEENLKIGKDGINPAIPDTKINFISDILEHSRLFYGLGNSHSEILDLGKTSIGAKAFTNCVVTNDNGTTTIKLNDLLTITIKPIGKSGKYTASINKTGGLYCALTSEGYFIANRDSLYYVSVNGQDVTITAINDTTGLVPRTMLYYTAELVVDESGNVSKGTKIVKKYHLFDDGGNHRVFEINRGEDVVNLLNLRRKEGLHTINSLYELHESLGGIFCEELQDDMLVASEKNHFCVTNYMNIVSGQRTQLYKQDKVYDLDDYYLPLKEMYIGYATNKSAFKCGVGNLNPRTSWNDSTGLTYIKTDSDILGAQGDFDHKADEAMMSTPTLVMTALAQGGNVHHVVDLIYRTVGLASLKSVEKELEVFKSQDSNKIYELVGRIVILHLSSNSDSLDIAEDIIRLVEKEFNLNLSNHERDSIMMPFSDPSIYGHLVPTIINIINKKAIKVKNPGLGMVMVPSFGVMLTWQINGEVYTALDLIDKVANVSSPANLKQNILAFLLLELDKILFLDKAHLFYDLGSIINVKVNDTTIVPININSLDAFVAFDDADWLYFSKYKNELEPFRLELETGGLISVLDKLSDGVKAKILSDSTDSCFLYLPGELQYLQNVTIGRDLLPNRIDMDIEITEPDGSTSVVKKSFYSIPRVKQAIKNGDELSRKEVNEILHNIKLNGGYVDEYGIKHRMLKHTYHKSQAIVSNMWSKEYGVSYRDSLLKVKTERLFKSEDIDTKNQLPDLDTINFIKSDNLHTRITFSQINKSLLTDSVKYYQYLFNNLSIQESSDGIKYVYKIDSDGDTLFITGIVVETGLDPIKDKELIVKNKSLLIDNGKVYKYILFVLLYTAAINHAQAQTVFSINEKAINEAVAAAKLINPKASISFKSVLSLLIKLLYLLDLYMGVTTSGEPIKGNNSAQIIESVQSLIDIQPNLTYLNNQKGHKYLTAPEEEKERLIMAFLKEEELRVRISFYKTLEVVSSRIPAQTLQSFMSMEVVGYSQMDTNVAYVTSLQTFLQGSDYDIDKAYMLTYFFDNNGKFIGWSPLFSLKSREALDASIKLPYPESIYIGIVSNTLDKNGNLDTNLFGFTNALKYNLNPNLLARVLENTKKVKELLDIIKLLEGTKSEESVIIEKYAELLELMYRLKNTVGERDILYLSLTAQELTEYKPILQKLNQHLHYVVPKHLEQLALLNSYTSKIHLVATDLDNMNSANTAITMEDALETTKLTSSVDGWRNLFNPATVYHMQDENLGGKVVISVAANGEKGYFTLYLYYTSMYHILQDNPDNTELFNLLRFLKTFDRIDGRWAEVFKLGNMHSKTVSLIGNLNQKLIDSLKSKNYLTDEEIEHEVDLMISQLLSAATDNAKELILSKINADMDYARMYFYLLTLGFTLDDIAAFMTSPAATMIIQLSKKNVFFKNQQSNSPEKAIRLFTDYNVNLGDFLQLNCVSKINKYIPYKLSFRKDKFTSIRQYIEAYVKGVYEEKPSEFFKQFLYISDPDSGEFAIQIKGDILKLLLQLDMYLEGLKSKRASAVQIYADYGYDDPEAQLEADIREFKDVYLGATELSDLVQIFLSSNLGLPTTADKLFNALDNMSKVIKKREREMTVNSVPLYREGKITKELLILGIQSIQTDPKLKEEAYLSPIVDRVMDAHLYNNFNLEKWFIDPEYRKLVIDYYNVIKHTFNIYHVIDSHPSYRVNIQELYPLALGLIRSSTSKFNLVKALRDRWKSLNDDFFNSKDLGKVTSVANKILIRKFLEASHILVPKAQNWKVLKGYLERDGVATESVTLNDSDGYSTFKYIMEEYIIPGLKSGLYPFINQVKFGSAIQDNAFIKGLVAFERDNIPFYKLNIDLNANGNTVYNDIKYNEFVKGFKALADIPVNNFTDILGNQYNLLDLFILYNIIVHLNLYGADTLTSLFKSVLTRKDTKSLLYKLEKFIGDFDRQHTTLSKAEIVQYDLDLAEKISPITSIYGERRLQAAYVRTNEHNILILKAKKGREYVPVPIFDVKADSNSLNINRMLNYVRYGTMSSPGRDGSQVLSNNLKSSNPEEVANAIKLLILMGKVVILVNC